MHFPEQITQNLVIDPIGLRRLTLVIVLCSSLPSRQESPRHSIVWPVSCRSVDSTQIPNVRRLGCLIPFILQTLEIFLVPGDFLAPHRICGLHQALCLSRTAIWNTEIHEHTSRCSSYDYPFLIIPYQAVLMCRDRRAGWLAVVDKIRFTQRGKTNGFQCVISTR